MIEFPTPQFDHVKLKLNSGQIVAISRAIPLQLFYERAVYLLPTNQRSRQEIYGRTQSAHFDGWQYFDVSLLQKRRI